MYITNPTTEVNNFVFIHRYLLYFFSFSHLSLQFSSSYWKKKGDAIENPYKKTLKYVKNEKI